MPDYPPEIRKAAAHAIDIERFRDPGYDGLVSGDPADLASAVLDAVAADLGQHVAGKILAHMEAHDPATADAAWTRRYRRNFRTAAQVASQAFLTEDDKKRMAAEALIAGNFVACPAPEDSDEH